jgi:pantothenate synthetase
MQKLYLSIKTSELQYLRIVEVKSFYEVEKLEAGKKYFILIACKIGKTRLIDNEMVIF